MFKYLFLAILILSTACSTSGPGLFKKKSLHESYAEKITRAGLDNTALGRSWMDAAARAMVNPQRVQIPFRETGYFPIDQARAAAWVFTAKRGQQLTIQLSKNPVSDFIIYLELFEPATGDRKPKLLAAADSSGKMDAFEVDDDGEYLLRLQPELLRSGEYTLSITIGPSLAYPIKATGSGHTKSFWGASRDNNTRKHEGIDLFAPKLTPVVAAADGFITRVNESELGGKVVWMRPAGKDYSLYYAHLDSQIVESGDQVKKGDILGLMGNTGNARTTSPHLHFGIYTNRGAVDPFPFVDPESKKPSAIKGDPEKLNIWARIPGGARLLPSEVETTGGLSLPSNQLVLPIAAIADKYQVLLPDGTSGYIPAEKVASSQSVIRTVNLQQPLHLLEKPDSTSPKKLLLENEERLRVKGISGKYWYVKNENGIEGWIPEQK
jgi:murein DD-endopeptidase MepM/ murein hydrolase activator NlpD